MVHVRRGLERCGGENVLSFGKRQNKCNTWTYFPVSATIKECDICLYAGLFTLGFVELRLSALDLRSFGLFMIEHVSLRYVLLKQ